MRCNYGNQKRYPEAELEKIYDALFTGREKVYNVFYERPSRKIG
jgi:hypothetical protein